jgi:hypothetical protein
MYSAWIKLDEKLPWIELEEAFQTKADAQKALKERLSKVKIKIIKLPKQEKQIRAQIKVRSKTSRISRVA